MRSRLCSHVIKCTVALLAMAVLPCCCFGGEILYLTNGFTLEASSHVAHGENVLVHTKNGTLEVPGNTIERIDVVADPSPEKPKEVSVSSSAAPLARPDLEGILSSAAVSQGLTASFVRSVAKVESNLRQDAVSPVGAIGLMQLMPGTAAELGVSPHDAGQNAAGGAQYLRQLLLQYHGDAALALAAYNAGPAAVAKYHGIPPYSETRRYVVRVLQEYLAEQKKAAATDKAELLAKGASAKAAGSAPRSQSAHQEKAAAASAAGSATLVAGR